jgi:energy-coupling factor transport system ATP-binding protein
MQPPVRLAGRHAGGMLELQSVCYHPATAAQPVLRDIHLRLQPGALTLVAGRSGSGKTTLLEVICGLARADGGTIRWNGEPMTARQLRWLCGLVFQFPERHFLGLTVGQELRVGQRRLSLTPAPEQLSGGQQRRLALAVQLLRDPKVLLLDEPTAGLDWAVRDGVLDLLQGLAQERALLVVTHEPEIFARLKPEGWRLEGGVLRPLGQQASLRCR